MPCDYSLYPPDWKQRRERILKRADNRCEFVENGWRCPACNHDEHPITGAMVVLTIAHLDHDPENFDVSDDRLMAMCQLHHNRYDRAHRNETRKRKAAIGQGELF